MFMRYMVSLVMLSGFGMTWSNETSDLQTCKHINDLMACFVEELPEGLNKAPQEKIVAIAQKALAAEIGSLQWYRMNAAFATGVLGLLTYGLISSAYKSAYKSANPRWDFGGAAVLSGVGVITGAWLYLRFTTEQEWLEELNKLLQMPKIGDSIIHLIHDIYEQQY